MNTPTSSLKATLRTTITLLGLSVLLNSPKARANGFFAASDQAEAELTLRVRESVSISRVSAIHFPDWQHGQGSIKGQGSACVFSTSGYYRVQAYSLNGQHHFALQHSDTHSHLPYTVQWLSTQNGQSQPLPLKHGALSNTHLSGSREYRCQDSAGFNAHFIVSLAQHDLDQARAGNYSDILSLIVSPE